MNLTAQQQAAVAVEGRWFTAVGPAGSGKTTVVMARYRRLVQATRPSRVLVICRDSGAARRFATAILAAVKGGFDALPITTAVGFAYDTLARAGDSPPALMGRAEERAMVRTLLADEDTVDWPHLGRFLHRPGFADEVLRGLSHLSSVTPSGPGWAELAAFAEKYRAALTHDGRVDLGTLFERATAALQSSPLDRFDHVLVDDVDALAPSAVRMLAALGGPAVTATLTSSFRLSPPGYLVRSNHPSVEAEAVAGELLAAHKQGVPWSGMAVLLRALGRRARSIGRALARHGIPVVPVPALATEEPVVRAMVDVLRWATGDATAFDRLLVSPLARLSPREVRAVHTQGAERPAHLLALREHVEARMAAGDSPADLAYEIWARELPSLGSSQLGAVDDRALDALVALVDGLAAYSQRRPHAPLAEVLAALDDGVLTPDPWRSTAAADQAGVTIASVAGSAGREWHTVVVAGCVEGEFPRVQSRRPLFDPADLGLPADDHQAEEARLFALATTRATGALVATAAPEPGVLLSRFVEAWPELTRPLPLAPGLVPPFRRVTDNSTPVCPDGRLTLSASQLDTYDDCPLRYAYQYVLRARDEPGIHANLGTLAHDILAEFLDPASDSPPRTFAGLMEVAHRRWRDDIGRYRPQLEEARRDLVDMLKGWWESDGAKAPDVLAVERPFEIDVGPHRLVGKIDRIDRLEGGGLRIIDYKTGKTEPKPGDVADDLQLAVYHLAASRDPDLASQGPAVQLQLHYVRTMNRYDQPVTEDHATRTEARVLEVAARILAEDFAPAVDANCRTCGFHRLCPLQEEGRQVSA